MTAAYKVEQTYFGEYACYFLIDGKCDTDERGTNGTGLKLYQSEEKAEAAGKRYLKKMQKNGFEI